MTFLKPVGNALGDLIDAPVKVVSSGLGDVLGAGGKAVGDAAAPLTQNMLPIAIAAGALALILLQK